jgi:CRISPR/Cas system-associated exonuclease Cas4 (RecB family)
MTINLSASSIKDFLVCSKRYYYRINSIGNSVPNDGMAVGSTVHYAIETCWNKNYSVAMRSALSYMQKNNISFTDNFYSNKISVSLKNFFANYKFLLTKNDETEKKFKIDFSNNVCFVGRIDRIIKSSDGNNMLVDWKTSQRDPFTIDIDPQFLLYKYAYEILYGRKPARVLYINVYTNRMLSLTNDADNYKKLFSVTVPEIISRIKSNNYALEGLKKRNACKYCQFREQCMADRGVKRK